MDAFANLKRPEDLPSPMTDTTEGPEVSASEDRPCEVVLKSLVDRLMRDIEDANRRRLSLLLFQIPEECATGPRILNRKLYAEAIAQKLTEVGYQVSLVHPATLIIHWGSTVSPSSASLSLSTTHAEQPRPSHQLHQNQQQQEQQPHPNEPERRQHQAQPQLEHLEQQQAQPQRQQQQQRRRQNYMVHLLHNEGRLKLNDARMQMRQALSNIGLPSLYGYGR